MRYQPLFDRVLVEEIEENKVTPGGLLIPDAYTSQKMVAFGTVLEVGTGRLNQQGELIPLVTKKGDIVAFPRQAPAPIPIFDEHGNETIVLLLREPDIIAIVHDMPQRSTILDASGRELLKMSPTSRAAGEMADSVYVNRDETAQAERAGWYEPGEVVDEHA